MIIASYIIVFTTIVLFLLSIIFVPTVTIGKLSFSPYWVISLLGALLLICINAVPFKEVISAFTSSSSVNPLKIAILFISMTALSVFLDEEGFFSFLASVFLKHFSQNQFTLFISLYVLLSLLTVFTSNDIIVLTFTPFLCYFAYRAHIDPLPYLLMEFVAANTWSMVLTIGNPTNIYLSSYLNIDFFTYMKVMILPTLAASLVSFFILLVLFYKKLKEPIKKEAEQTGKLDWVSVGVGLALLLTTTVLMAISSYIKMEMWLISAFFALLLLVFTVIYSFIRKEDRTLPLLKRLPYNLLPFILSMFVLVLALRKAGFSAQVKELLQQGDQVFTYGFSGLITANLINNIPMSVFYASLLDGAEVKAVYAAVIASNLAAYLTPVGALAGIMWTGMVRKQGIKMNFLKFTLYGIILCLPTMSVALLVLRFIPL